MIYKIVTKVIALRIKTLLYNYISEEQYGFLRNRRIHEAIEVAQETFHSIKNKDLNVFFLNIGLEKHMIKSHGPSCSFYYYT